MPPRVTARGVERGLGGAKGPGSVLRCKKATISATYMESMPISFSQRRPHVLDSCKIILHILVKILEMLFQQLLLKRAFSQLFGRLEGVATGDFLKGVQFVNHPLALGPSFSLV